VHQPEPHSQERTLRVLVADSGQILFHGLAFDLEQFILCGVEHRRQFDGGHPGVANVLSEALDDPIVVV
jgi:hypothetical protein